MVQMQGLLKYLAPENFERFEKGVLSAADLLRGRQQDDG
jgi:hypothetical protein